MRSEAAHSLRGTVRVKGGVLGSLGSIESQTAFAVVCWRETAGKAVEGGDFRDERSPCRTTSICPKAVCKDRGGVSGKQCGWSGLVP